jgi:hypothetical protein
MPSVLSTQHGVFSTTQLSQVGVSRSFFARHPQLFHELLPRTYSMIPPPVTPEAMAWAAFLWAAPALLSHLSALWLYELAPAPEVQHVLIRHSRRLEVPDDLRLHRTSVLTGPDGRAIDALRATAPIRTLIDSATLLPVREVVAATAAAAQKGLCRLDEVRRYAVAHPSLPGAARMMRALVQLEGGLQSIREVDLLAALRAAGLPEPVAQYALYDAAGKLLTIPDFAYPQWKIAIFYDGRAAHLTAASFDGDAIKTAALTAAGWRVLRVTSALLNDPALLAAAVGELIRAAA